MGKRRRFSEEFKREAVRLAYAERRSVSQEAEQLSLRMVTWWTLYGSGLWLLEAFRLRVKDLDFERLQATVREGKAERTG